MKTDLQIPGFPINFVLRTESMEAVMFIPRNVRAVETVKRMGSAPLVMNELAKGASELYAASQTGLPSRSVVQRGRDAVVLCVEGTRDEKLPVLNIGVYQFPANIKVEWADDDLDRLNAWAEATEHHELLIMDAAISLWISVANPAKELIPGRAATVQKLENGDYLCVQFSGIGSGCQPFMLFIEGAESAEQLIEEDRRAQLVAIFAGEAS